jgi:hypothetical protein
MDTLYIIKVTLHISEEGMVFFTKVLKQLDIGMGKKDFI